jgi:hypothetical protein
MTLDIVWWKKRSRAPRALGAALSPRRGERVAVMQPPAPGHANAFLNPWGERAPVMRRALPPSEEGGVWVWIRPDSTGSSRRCAIVPVRPEPLFEPRPLLHNSYLPTGKCETLVIGPDRNFLQFADSHES